MSEHGLGGGVMQFCRRDLQIGCLAFAALARLGARARGFDRCRDGDRRRARLLSREERKAHRGSLRRDAFEGREPGHEKNALAAEAAHMAPTFVANEGQVASKGVLLPAGREPGVLHAHRDDDGAEPQEHGPPSSGKGSVLGFEGEVPGRPRRDAGRRRQGRDEDQLPGRPPFELAHTNVPSYHQVVYKNVWPGIDVTYSTTATDSLAYSFLVHPGANPKDVRLAYQGVSGLSVGAGGALTVETPIGGFVDEKPVVYQQVGGRRVLVPSSFSRPEGSSYGFRVGDYDRSRTLVIDPVYLVYSGFFGSVSSHSGLNTVNSGIALDSSGDAYITGTSNAPDLPVTAGAFQSSLASAPDSYVAKINASGSALVYVTYLGGSASDLAAGIAVSPAGNAYVTGSTTSTNFPTTSGAFQTTFGGNDTHGGLGDEFVTELNTAGTGLVYSTYLGGSGIRR